MGALGGFYGPLQASPSRRVQRTALQSQAAGVWIRGAHCCQGSTAGPAPLGLRGAGGQDGPPPPAWEPATPSRGRSKRCSSRRGWGVSHVGLRPGTGAVS